MKTLAELDAEEQTAYAEYRRVKAEAELIVKPANDAWMAAMRATNKERIRLELIEDAKKEQNGNA